MKQPLGHVLNKLKSRSTEKLEVRLEAKKPYNFDTIEKEQLKTTGGKKRENLN